MKRDQPDRKAGGDIHLSFGGRWGQFTFAGSAVAAIAVLAVLGLIVLGVRLTAPGEAAAPEPHEPDGRRLLE